MEFHVGAGTGMPDVGIIESAIQALDPAAVVDMDASGRVLRLATWIESPQLVEAFARIGWRVRPEQVVQQPSVCCGGCGG